MNGLTSIEICAGGGGQALGLAQAGFHHIALVENDRHACATLRGNRKSWRVFEKDVNLFLKEDAPRFSGKTTLVAGGVPCPPFSHAGQKLGPDDPRDLFPVALRLVEAVRPQAVMLENVRGLLDAEWDNYRADILERLRDCGFVAEWRLLNACDFGVPQLRPRAVLVAIRAESWTRFSWPQPSGKAPRTVGLALRDLMASAGWEGADQWAREAHRIAPTLVGGSKLHGGPDLGPTRAKKEWAELGVDGMGIANAAPTPAFEGRPRLTVAMAAVLQGFPEKWVFAGGKTAAYRQVGNAFPPPVARAVGIQIRKALQ